MAGIFNVSPNSNLTEEDKKLLIDNLKFGADSSSGYAPGDPITKAYSRVPFADFSEQGQDYLQSLWLTFEDNDDVEITFSGSWGASTYVCNPRIYGHWAGVNNEVLNDIYRERVSETVREDMLEGMSDYYEICVLDENTAETEKEPDFLQDYFDDAYKWIVNCLSGYKDRIAKINRPQSIKDEVCERIESDLEEMKFNYSDITWNLHKNIDNLGISEEEWEEIAKALEGNFYRALMCSFGSIDHICKCETGYTLEERYWNDGKDMETEGEIEL